MISKAGFLVVMSLFAGASSAAKADNFVFTDGTNVVTFSLPASPVPTAVYPSCPNSGVDSFCIDDKTILVNGVATHADLDFFNDNNNGGVLFDLTGLEAPIINQDGLPLFSGPLTAPTFVPGLYVETNEQDAGPKNEFSGGFDVTITAAPEPSSLVLLGTGVLTAFGTLRRKLRVS